MSQKSTTRNAGSFLGESSRVKFNKYVSWYSNGNECVLDDNSSSRYSREDILLWHLLVVNVVLFFILIYSVAYYSSLPTPACLDGTLQKTNF